MEFLSYTDLYNKLSLGASDPALDSALDRAESSAIEYLSARLGSSIRQVLSATEYFQIDRNRDLVVNGGVFLKLKTGFATVSAVEWSYTLDDPVAGETATWNPAGVVYDWEKGSVLVLETSLPENSPFFVKVQYDAGFASGTTLPGWLSEALTLQTILEFYLLPISQSEQIQILEDLKVRVDTLVSRHHRNIPHSLISFM